MLHPTIAIIGASRGFGAAFARLWAQKHPQGQMILVARKQEKLQAVAGEIATEANRVDVLPCDLAQPSQQELLIKNLSSQNLTQLFYFAGGGPYGAYADKNWQDHQWALEVSFLAPARILHAALSWPAPPQAVFVGSTVAEDGAHPQAASYSAAKAALKALLSSAVLENPKADLRLFSPGYMDTDLLPSSAPVRQTGAVADPRVAASQLLDWVLQTKSDWYFPFTTLSK